MNEWKRKWQVSPLICTYLGKKHLCWLFFIKKGIWKNIYVWENMNIYEWLSLCRCYTFLSPLKIMAGSQWCSSPGFPGIGIGILLPGHREPEKHPRIGFLVDTVISSPGTWSLFCCLPCVKSRIIQYVVGPYWTSADLLSELYQNTNFA